MHAVWRYPSARSPRDLLRFYFPDDAFFTGRGTAILSNQEQNETIIKIAYPSGKIVWSYGHARHLRVPLRGTCTSPPTMPICSRTARSRWPMRSTAGCW